MDRVGVRGEEARRELFAARVFGVAEDDGAQGLAVLQEMAVGIVAGVQAQQLERGGGVARVLGRLGAGDQAQLGGKVVAVAGIVGVCGRTGDGAALARGGRRGRWR